MKTSFMVLSDLHLEKKSKEEKAQLLVEINKKIDENKNNNINLIILLAGDIDNEDKAYAWMEKIESEVVYIAGNHEFWNADFYDVKDKLKKNAPHNVSFLYDDFAVLGDYIVVGTTLWTDVGKSLNPDLFGFASFKMNDVFNIKAKTWYDNSKNIERVNKEYPDYVAEQVVTEKKWNSLIEIEENQRSISFFKQFDKIYDFLTKNENEIGSEYFKNDLSFLKKSKAVKDYDELLGLINEYQKNENILFKEDILSILTNKDSFKLFSKMKNVHDLKNKKLILLTHHLPFYEELLLMGNRKIISKQKWERSVVGFIEPELFSVRSGTEYNHHYNYLFECTKGRVTGNQDITRVVNYCNNGSRLIPQSFIDKIKMFIHGHDHLINHIEIIKGRVVVANPGAGWFFNAFSFENSGCKLKIDKFNGIDASASEEIKEDLKKEIINNSLAIISDDLIKHDITPMIDYFVLMNADRNKLLGDLSDLEKRCNILQDLLIKSVKEGLSEKDEDYLEIAYDSLVLKERDFFDDLSKLDLAFKVRKMPSFSMDVYLSTKYQQQYEMAEFILFGSESIKSKFKYKISQLENGFPFSKEDVMRDLFEKKTKIRNAIIKVKKVNGILKNKKNNSLLDIDSESMRKLVKLLKPKSDISFLYGNNDEFLEKWEEYKKEINLEFKDTKSSRYNF